MSDGNSSPESNAKSLSCPQKLSHAAACSTGIVCHTLLAAILAARGCINELSNGGRLEFERCIGGEGREDGGGDCFLEQRLYGPYHDIEEGSVQHHGLLFTVECGAHVSDVVQAAKRAPMMDAITHVHIAAAR
ncbi:hypothetical protein AcW1_003678 [Taiwanofungus camphoratus]|nr:hypothetical protein AcW1_003678 [Antrodia cinnamomea]